MSDVIDVPIGGFPIEQGRSVATAYYFPATLENPAPIDVPGNQAHYLL